VPSGADRILYGSIRLARERRPIGHLYRVAMLAAPTERGKGLSKAILECLDRRLADSSLIRLEPGVIATELERDQAEQLAETFEQFGAKIEITDLGPPELVRVKLVSFDSAKMAGAHSSAGVIHSIKALRRAFDWKLKHSKQTFDRVRDGEEIITEAVLRSRAEDLIAELDSAGLTAELVTP